MTYEELHREVMDELGGQTGCIPWQEALLKVIAPRLNGLPSNERPDTLGLDIYED